jgi:hypothetical protein
VDESLCINHDAHVVDVTSACAKRNHITGRHTIAMNSNSNCSDLTRCPWKRDADRREARGNKSRAVEAIACGATGAIRRTKMRLCFVD